ncbi:hypothetical protein [Sediminibacillus massiliensis]|uniref:hypothetical protein n=1 Tax=Sediminibacillus massiliensis TaxID=1926277 RepID=UPI00098871CE|nr:hypothetical protein [Sediminibacillus massiliensis]
MREVIFLIADIMNYAHDILMDTFGINMTDKQLHFWIIGIIGMITFFFVYIAFKIVEKIKWSISLFAFIYTFTVMVVFVFAIELQQAVTNRGNMELADALIGLWGFLVFFMIYAAIAIAIYIIYYLIKKRK